ncbi:hypothetical protein CARUB_v10003559mg [Capsella rubella]|uniref:Prolamin-like domain-containing protein n=1 Tax=Capsella rubella TaxID=81985 RepID=R0HCS3_9BRAS|nr:uncharacterized protein LOC17884076 [Capsella rubella]EOA22835.1 hypothetical protein CARUB_v10003559mg [Capsella rubella]
MKNLAILIAMILFSSSCVTCLVIGQQDFESNPSLGTEELQWWHYHHFYPYYHPKPHWPFPATGGKALPPLPAGFHPIPFHPPPVVTKCLSDCKDVRTCFADIVKAFFTRKPAIGLDCCASIKKMDDDCQKTVFGAFHNPFFDCLVKLHCSTKAASTPSAPSPA